MAAPPVPPPKAQPVPANANTDGGATAVPDPAAPTPSTSVLSSSAPSSALHNFKLLAALRSGSPNEIQPFIDELSSPNGNPDATPGRLLGMAVRVAPAPAIAQILKSVSSPNLPVAPNTTATPLHVAAEIGRTEAVELLLADPRIDDTIHDEQGRTALECASEPVIAAIIEESRSTLQARFQSLLGSYVSSALNSPDESSSMGKFLEGPRVEVVNLNTLDQRTGTSLLHEAARRRDLRLVEIAIKRGADVFVRDRRGKRVLESEKGGDERIRAYLRQFSNQDTVIQLKSDGRPPDLKGFLSKWVNYRSGWKTRWFVLENGVLSYYRSREDEHLACRGSIALTNAYLTPLSDGTRFEVGSAASSSTKFIVKSNLRGEIARWTQALRLNIEFYQKGGKAEQLNSDARSISDGRSARYAPSIAPSAHERALGTTLADLPAADQFLHPALKRTPTSASAVSGLSRSRGARREGSPSHAGGAGDTTDDARDHSDDQDSVNGDQPDTIPHDQEFELSMLNLKAQLELTEQLVGSIVTPPSSSHGSADNLTRTTSYSRQMQVKEALRESLTTLSTLVTKQHTMIRTREKYLLNRIKREVEARRLWEENLLAVAQQQAETDRMLTEASKDNEKKRKALRQARGVLAELSSAASVPGSPVTGATPTTEPDTYAPIVPKKEGHSDFAPSRPPASPAAALRRSISGVPSSTLRQSISNIHEAHELVAAAADEGSEDEDEFFDAIESGTLPNLRLYDSINQPVRPSTPPIPRKESTAVPAGAGAGAGPVQQKAADTGKEGTIVKYLARESLDSYSHVRNRLPIDDDKRPSVSLWSILKSSIGKDLTKISFPVSFNECTSMLQRMAEDMEYDACLTVAAGEEDSMKRIAFVGAFAMSNYSSTIGRIAKPFNPMLSQSFEYAIPDRYRYISEQVSHHPPISACYAEAPTWKYYGEVDAKNKFQGRYFEIRPTGVAHCDLIIPKSWVKPGLTYPSAGPEYPDGMVAEHYSWKKVITNVSNFIMGNPIIDHYGDLVVTNHRTGETCTLTFKPRGWRGKDAFEIKGHADNAQGEVEWDIAGRWDSQLIARKAGVSHKPLEVDDHVEDMPEAMQLWRNTEKPPAPFNLTPFAVTLNDIPTGLENYLAPTDCRLRTDQRAFENADYDKAQLLKSANEEKQRETRKLRAEGVMPPHEPRWFTEEVDQDTNERVWEPKRAADGEVKFWHDREEQAARTPGQKWPEVDHIFVEHDAV